MRSATPQLSRKVAEDTGPSLQKIRAKAIISIRPSLITAAFVLSPKPRPSQKPAPTATMFCRTHTKIIGYIIMTFFLFDSIQNRLEKGSKASYLRSCNERMFGHYPLLWYSYLFFKGKLSREKEHNHQQTNSLKTWESTSYNNVCKISSKTKYLSSH